MSRPLFSLGQIVATPGALEVIEKNFINWETLLTRHVTGDWEGVDPEDVKENNLSVKQGYRILSSYGQGEQKLWIITEADRSVTTILRPDDY